jgi:carbon monoxide dehydrogenase subunit G
VPTARFSRALELGSPAESCWKTLTDVPTLVSWISVVDEGREIEPLRHYSAVLMDRVGPFRLRADLDIRLSDVQPGRHVSLTARGEDRQVGSTIRVEAAMRLGPSEGGTLVSVDGRYEVAGRVATLGAGTIRKKADKILEEFFGNLNMALG